jgi:hypothetical protein
MHTSNSDEHLTGIDFGDAYSDGQKFKKGLVRHFHRLVDSDQLELQGRRPVIYINTWNHLFSEKDNNPELPKLKYSIYPGYTGARSDAEPQRK